MMACKRLVLDTHWIKANKNYSKTKAFISLERLKSFVILSNGPSISCIPYYYVKKKNIGGHWTAIGRNNKKTKRYMGGCCL